MRSPDRTRLTMPTRGPRRLHQDSALAYPRNVPGQGHVHALRAPAARQPREMVPRTVCPCPARGHETRTPTHSHTAIRDDPCGRQRIRQCGRPSHSHRAVRRGTLRCSRRRWRAGARTGLPRSAHGTTWLSIQIELIDGGGQTLWPGPDVSSPPPAHMPTAARHRWPRPARTAPTSGRNALGIRQAAGESDAPSNRSLLGAATTRIARAVPPRRYRRSAFVAL